MSLKKRLEDIICESKEPITYNQISEFCRVWGYRLSNAERRLRESHLVKAVYGKKGYIVAYKKVEAQASLF